MLPSLAPELIQAISRELESIKDIKSFRLTCKQMDQALAAEVLRWITVDINPDTFERELCKLQHFSQGSPACRLIQGIGIKSLSPALGLENSWAPTGAAEGAAETEDLKKYLYDALSSLKTVRTVRWTPGLKDAEWAHTAVVNALKVLPNLQRLYVTLPTCQIEIPFHSFTTLRHIDVYCVDEEVHHPAYHQKTFKNLVKMISQSPLLDCIRVSHNPDYSGRRTRSLHQLFECYPESIPPLRLKHLSLTNCFVRLDGENIMRHLRHLTSLSLENLLEPCYLHSRYSVNDSDSISKDVLDKQSCWGSSYEQIWRTIGKTDLRLEEIALDTTPPALLDYIGSYSGLKKLKIITRGYNDGVASDNAAKKFYEALEKHADSIEELDVKACFEGLWCFGHHNQVLFSTLQHLTTLSVRVRSSDVRSNKDIISVLIDTAVTYMPQLESLFASAADLEAHRRSKCGSSSSLHYARCKNKIAARVLKYTAPLGCKRLPTFKIGKWSPEGAFVGQSPDLLKKVNRLQYLPDPVNVT